MAHEKTETYRASPDIPYLPYREIERPQIATPSHTAILGRPFGKEGKERQENGGNPSFYKHFALLTDPDVGREEVGSGTLEYLEPYEAFFGSGGLCRISVSYQRKSAVSDEPSRKLFIPALGHFLISYSFEKSQFAIGAATYTAAYWSKHAAPKMLGSGVPGVGIIRECTIKE